MFDSYFSKKKKHTYNAFVSLFVFFLNDSIRGTTEIKNLVVFYKKHVTPDKKKKVIASQFAKYNQYKVKIT
jgi:hypothetical protein